MEQIFSIARILIALKSCQLQTNHLNQICLSTKIGPSIQGLGVQTSDFVNEWKVEFELSKDLDAKFEEEVEWEEVQDLCDFRA
jgi:hypothetical protein